MKISKGKILFKKLTNFKKKASLIVSPKTSDIRRNISSGLNIFEEGALLKYIFKVKVIPFFKNGETESVNLIIHTKTPGMIIGRGGVQINKLEKYLSGLVDAPIKIYFKEIDVTKDIYDYTIADGLVHANTLTEKIKWLFK